MRIPLETPFFLRLDGWKFRRLSQSINAEKPFDKRLAECLTYSAQTIFKESFDPTLVYVASDELNILFLEAPFNRRAEKLNSVIPGLVSSAFVFRLQELFRKNSVAAFDSRIIIVSTIKKLIEYLAWRQNELWRNYNNAYAYWILRNIGYGPSEASRELRGLKAEELHELAFTRGVNLSETPVWQRRGILVYKEPYVKETARGTAERWMVKVEWKPPLFTTDIGIKLIKQIIFLKKRKRKRTCLSKV